MQTQSAKYVTDLLRLARNHEELVQHLYQAFAEKLSEKKDFWLGIAAVEAKHVRIMEMLEEHARQSMLRMRQDSTLTIEDVQHAVDHLQLYLEEVQARGISPRRAAVVAKEIEEGILENNFDQQFLTEHVEAEELLKRLCSDTRGHSAAMDALMVKRDEFSMLVHEKVASQVEVELARTIAAKEGLAVDSVLADRFDVDPAVIRKSIANYYHLPTFEKQGRASLPDPILKPVKGRYEDMKKRLYVPVAAESSAVSFALGNPGDIPLRDEIAGLYASKPIHFLVALSDEILSQIDELFGLEMETKGVSAATLIKELQSSTSVASSENPAEEIVSEEDSALVKLVNLVIEEAYQKGASDIHIEPMRDEDTVVRVRVDGLLLSLMNAPARYSRAMISRIKIMAGLDISERRVPQSGKIQYRRWGRLDSELRVETYPTANNQEDAVIRILSTGTPLRLDELHLSQANQSMLAAIVSQPYGLFLCVGPTGSGKTTTLHSALGHINTRERKILTIEDPIEITQKGMRQVQVNRKAGVTFATALRSFLRADPDVIMVGEMRDLETAHTALEASLTGHLVFSTLHTNSAPETITRLLDMGLDPFAFADSLAGVLAQRLSRRLCPNCKQPDSGFDARRLLLAEEYENADEFAAMVADTSFGPRMPARCEQCGHTGYRGRIALHELLPVDDAMRELIMHKATAAEIRRHGCAYGMRSLRQDGIAKVLSGLTTHEEVKRVCLR